MERGEREEMPEPPVGSPAAVEGGDALLGAGADLARSSPSPPAAAVEVVPVVVNEEPEVVVPAAAAVVVAAAADRWYQDHFNLGLLVLATMILASVLVYDLGAHPTTWWGQIAAMTGVQWRAAFFLAVGDMVSLGLIFSQTGYFRRLWAQEEVGGAGLAVVVPLLAGAVNCGVWLAYGVVVEGMNMSVIAVNCTGVVFNLVYTFVFYHRSGTPRGYTIRAISLAVAIAMAIAAIDLFVLIDACGWEAPTAVGWSGVMTGLMLYIFRAYVAMMTAHENRAAGGFSAQTLASFANALLWFVYACVQGDYSMMISNGVGIVCFLIQAAQVVYFRLTPPEEETPAVRQRLLVQEP